MRRQRRNFLAVTAIATGLASGVLAQGTILERQQAMFRRNVGTAEEQREQFHRIASPATSTTSARNRSRRIRRCTG